MRRLVALDLPAGEAFLSAMRRAHEEGDAVLPLHPRLPRPAKERLVDAFAPALVVGPDGGEQRRPRGVPTEDGDAFVVATSGSTGEPKGVVLTHEGVAASAMATSRRLRIDPSTDSWLCCLPVAHVGGLSVICRALVTGTGLEVHPRFDERAVAAAAEGGITCTSLVPTALSRLGESAKLFKVVLCGGQAAPQSPPENVVCTYGLTETGSGVVYDGVPLDGVDVIVDEKGEIGVRGPMLLRCYRDGTDPRDKNGFFFTGDGGAILADGRLVVFGRRGEVITTGGEKVWPAVVENILKDCSGVAEVAVLGLPHREWGEMVVAVVVASSSEEPPTLEALRAAVRGELGPIAAPKALHLRPELPRTAIGKIARAELRAELCRQLASTR